MPTKVLVAGASGRLGAEIVKALRARGVWVRALTRDPGRLHGTADEVFVGDLTSPGTLSGVCREIDQVFTCAGLAPIPGGKTKQTFRQVNDYGNRALLAEAARAGVERFGCVSPFGGMYIANIEYIRAHESFAAQLKASGLDYRIVRCTVMFSSLDDLVRDAGKGKISMRGDGSPEVNPIHQADLATVCVDAMAGKEREVDAGGPIVYTRQEIAEMAFASVGKQVNIRHAPEWTRALKGRFFRFMSSQQSRDVTQFLVESSLVDMVAPLHGEHVLPEYFETLGSTIA